MVSLMSCEQKNTSIVTEFDCSSVDMGLIREYTLSCIKAAGSGGESEPEDWIWRCEKLSKDMYCTKKKYAIVRKTIEGVRRVVSKIELVPVKVTLLKK